MIESTGSAKRLLVATNDGISMSVSVIALERAAFQILNWSLLTVEILSLKLPV